MPDVKRKRVDSAVRLGAIALHAYERDNYGIRDPDETWGDLDVEDRHGYLDAAAAVLEAANARADD